MHPSTIQSYQIASAAAAAAPLPTSSPYSPNLRKVASCPHFPSVPFQESISLIGNHHGSQKELHEKIITYFKSIPLIQFTIDQFFQIPENNEKRHILQCGKISWHDLKTNPKLRGDFPLDSPRDLNHEVIEPDSSWEGFRLGVEQLLSDCSNLILRHLKITPIKTIACGTIGTQADLDLVFSQHHNAKYKKHTEEELFLGKVLFDTLFEDVCHFLPGPLLDLETYTSHPGERRIFETLYQNKASASIQKKYVYIEKLLVIMQAALSLPQHIWEMMKAHFLNSTKHQKEIIKGMIAECETFLQVVRNGENRELLMDMYEDESVTLDQQLTHHQSRLLAEKRLSSEDVVKEIEQLATKFRQQDPIKARSYMMSYTMPILMRLSHAITELDEAIERKKPSKAKDEDQISILLRLGLRGTQFPESYFTNGAYNSVCADRGGQIETMQKRHSLYALQKTGTFERPSKFSKRRNGSESYTSEIFDAIHRDLGSLYGKEDIILPPPTPYENHDCPLIQEHVECLDENCVMFIHKYYLEIEQGANTVNALVSASKYEERSLSSLRKALKECLKFLRNEKTHSLSKDKILYMVNFLEKVTQTYEIASDLLKCKRKVTIAEEVSLDLIKKYHRDIEETVSHQIDQMPFPEHISPEASLSAHFIQQALELLKINGYKEEQLEDKFIIPNPPSSLEDKWTSFKNQLKQVLFPEWWREEKERSFSIATAHLIVKMKNMEKDPFFQIRNLRDGGSISAFPPEAQLLEVQSQIRPICHPQLEAILHASFGVPTDLKEIEAIREFNQTKILNKYDFTNEQKVHAHIANFNHLIEEGLVLIESLGVIPRFYEKGTEELSLTKIWKSYEEANLR